MIDTHAHLYYDKFDADRSEVLARARAAGVERIINIGTEVSTSARSVELARAEPGLYAAVGIHPTTPVTDLGAEIAALEDLARAEPSRVVAVGEIGLDYYWKDVPPAAQKTSLLAQLELARRLDLPVVYHCRDALEDLFAILEKEDSLPPGVFHCFAGGPAQVPRALALGCYLSFAGNVTYPRATELQAALRAAPLDRLLLETDSPFLPPQPFRGKRNEPAHVKLTRDFIAREKGLTPEEVDRATDANAARFFRW